MKLTIGSNITSQSAQRRLTEAVDKGSKALERLSSGMRINGAADDPAGLAVSTKLTTAARVYGKAISNLNDGVSLINVAEAGLRQLQEIATRQRELATQAANGSYSAKQRQALAAECDALSAESSRIIASTSFNGISLLSQAGQSIGIQAGSGTEGALNISLGDALSRNAGDGTFDAYVSITSPGALATGVGTADFNNDGRPDLVSLNYAVQGASIYLSNGDRTFTLAGTFTTDTQPPSVAIADINKDGNQDLVASSRFSDTLSVMLGNGNGTFQPRTVLGVPSDPGTVKIADLNNDGNLDLLVQAAGNCYRYSGNGSGTFQAPVALGIDGSAGVASLGDFNGDGTLDLIQGSVTGSGNTLWYGNGDGTFKAVQNIFGSAGYGGMPAVADFNRDGRLDFATVNGGGSNNVEVHTQLANGTFSTKVYDAPNNNGAYLGTGDFNGDGILDFMATGQVIGGLSVLLGNSDGTFNKALLASSPSAVHQPISADFDGDGRTDIAAPMQGASNVVMWWARGGRSTAAQYFDLTTREGALSAITTLDATKQRIGAELGILGAAVSRFEVAAETLRASRENTIAAAARITDADMADEAAAVTRFQILQQSSASVLAQANQQPALTLQLLKQS